MSGIMCTPITEAQVVREGQAEAGVVSRVGKVREAWAGPLEQKGWEPSWEGLAPADQEEPPAARPASPLCTPPSWSSLLLCLWVHLGGLGGGGKGSLWAAWTDWENL